MKSIKRVSVVLSIATYFFTSSTLFVPSLIVPIGTIIGATTLLTGCGPAGQVRRETRVEERTEDRYNERKREDHKEDIQDSRARQQRMNQRKQ